MLEQNIKQYHIPTITVHLQPEEKKIEMYNPKTAKQLLNKLGLREESAIIIRNNKLLTPDVRIYDKDDILVRKVTSSG